MYICKEANVLFNDAINTFYLRLYGVRHMVKNYSAREETRCRHIGYSFRLAARVLLYASSHKQNNTYHGLCYTSRRALAGARNSLYVCIYVYCVPVYLLVCMYVCMLRPSVSASMYVCLYVCILRPSVSASI